MKTKRLEAVVSLPSPLQQYPLSVLPKDSPAIYIKRDDMVHPVVSGNKFRKLKGHLDTFQQGNYQGIITMGGAWSNHIHACSWLCHALNIPCVIIVRGPEPKHYSATLADASQWGASLEFLNREDYRTLRHAYENNTSASCEVLSQWSDYLFIPEGGRHLDSRAGFAMLADELDHSFDAVYIAVGTASSLASLAYHWKNPDTEFHGVLAVDAQTSQKQTLNLITDRNHHRIMLRPEFTFGGYAKTNTELNEFIEKIYSQSGIPLDPVYTAKAFYALLSDIRDGRHSESRRILFIHSGGLQGLRGYSDFHLVDVKAYYQQLEHLPFTDH